ncbi:MAG: MCP four helix bundle domain-containing protein [Rhodospirillales bacterium]|nr:MCP four helix bundle domain-containing protein [Rhodospirillales bacterium]
MSFLGKLGIGGRFRLAFSALLVAVLLVGGIGAFQAYQMNGITSELAENRLPSVRTMGRLNAGVARYRQIQASLLLVSAEGRAEIVGRMNATVAEIEGAQRDYERLLDPGEEAQVLYPAILSAKCRQKGYSRVSRCCRSCGKICSN